MLIMTLDIVTLRMRIIKKLSSSASYLLHTRREAKALENTNNSIVYTHLENADDKETIVFSFILLTFATKLIDGASSNLSAVMYCLKVCIPSIIGVIQDHTRPVQLLEVSA